MEEKEPWITGEGETPGRGGGREGVRGETVSVVACLPVKKDEGIAGGREGGREDLPGGRVKRGEQQILSQSACLCQPIEEGGLAAVGVSDQGNDGVAL